MANQQHFYTSAQVCNLYKKVSESAFEETSYLSCRVSFVLFSSSCFRDTHHSGRSQVRSMPKTILAADCQCSLTRSEHTVLCHSKLLYRTVRVCALSHSFYPVVRGYVSCVLAQHVSRHAFCDLQNMFTGTHSVLENCSDLLNCTYI